MRTTSGKSMPPRVRQRYRPTWLISWSRQGYENASYCISHTGRQPAMHRPTAAPRIPASASGVSTQRSGPKRSRHPAVARKTPPERPTSSPSTVTLSSRASSVCRASVTASTRSRKGTEDPPQLREVRSERRRRLRIRMLEEKLRPRRRFGFRSRDPRAHRVERVVLDIRRQRLGQQPGAPQVRLVAADALALPLLLDALEIDVRAWIVGGRVRRRAIRDRLDQRRPVARTRALDSLARCLVDGEDVAAVDADTGDAVTRGLVDERLRLRLRRDRRRDRPLVVVAE